MDPFKEFVAAPSIELLQKLKVEELWQVVEHYKLTLDVARTGQTKKK